MDLVVPFATINIQWNPDFSKPQSFKPLIRRIKSHYHYLLQVGRILYEISWKQYNRKKYIKREPELSGKHILVVICHALSSARISHLDIVWVTDNLYYSNRIDDIRQYMSSKRFDMTAFVQDDYLTAGTWASYA